MKSLVDDVIEEDIEFFVVNLSNVSNNAVIADPQATIRILDNENNTAPTADDVSASGSEDPVDESDNPLPIEVTLAGSDNDDYDAVTSFTLNSLPANGTRFTPMRP